MGTATFPQNGYARSSSHCKYSLSTIIHIAEASWKRLWWLFPTAVLARNSRMVRATLVKPESDLRLDPFLMQIVCTILAPTPLVAANFVILGRIITQLGGRFSRLSADWYTILFCSCDIVPLVVQAVGGGASIAVQNGRDPAKGGNIMLGGIVFQLAAIIAYVALAAEFLTRYWTNKPVHRNGEIVDKESGEKPHMQPRMKLMIFGMVFMTTLFFIRSVYRTMELSNGWSGRIISTQVYFNVLDGAAIVLAMFTLNVFHPGFLLDLTPASSRDIDIEDKPAKPSLADSE
ncbi:hypothetical protein EWM64_g8254 [Hericium alpestre]|uniref:RTA1 like protein n=1 Tax=Hericium alpestre TaxID=135208 RepID=A0A4Y9ZQI4_9AGAM|nr:hypothetical protein EWM64_g8254 [Hericium alpestre]